MATEAMTSSLSIRCGVESDGLERNIQFTKINTPHALSEKSKELQL